MVSYLAKSSMTIDSLTRDLFSPIVRNQIEDFVHPSFWDGRHLICWIEQFAA